MNKIMSIKRKRTIKKRVEIGEGTGVDPMDDRKEWRIALMREWSYWVSLLIHCIHSFYWYFFTSFPSLLGLLPRCPSLSILFLWSPKYLFFDVYLLWLTFPFVLKFVLFSNYYITLVILFIINYYYHLLVWMLAIYEQDTNIFSIRFTFLM